MKRLIFFLFIISIILVQVSAAVYNSSTGSYADITMVLKPASAEGCSVGFSSRRDKIVTIDSTQTLTLSYEKEVDSEITASGTYYPYWYVTGQSTGVKVNLYWDDDSLFTKTDDNGNETTWSIFTLTRTYTDSSGSTKTVAIESGDELDSIDSNTVATGITQIDITTDDLRSIPYGTVYTLKFTLKVETA